MLKFKMFALSVILFVIFDFIWLGIVMKDFNMRQLAEIGRIENGVFQMHYGAAAMTYILMGWAVVSYVLPQLTNSSSVLQAFLVGAPLGLIIYGVFDLTNYAILKSYPVAFMAPDIAWGGFVFGLVTVVVTKLKFII